MAKRAEATRTIVIAVAAGTIFVVVAVLFANAAATSRVSENAESLHWVNATLGTAALGRASAGQYVAFAGNPVSADTAETAENELDEVTAALADLMADSPPTLVNQGHQLVAALQERPVDLKTVDDAYQPVAAELRQEQDRLEAAIVASDETANRVSAVIRLLVTLVLPAAAILIYRRRAIAQLREAELRMETQLEAEREISRAKDQFVAGLSHEMRTPLTGIYGFSEMLLNDGADPDTAHELLAIINSESAELTRMVDDFIAASRIHAGTLEVELLPVDLRDLAATVSERYERRGVEIAVTGEAELALADPGRVRQVLVDLVSNAVTYGGSRVSIRLSNGDGVVRCAVIDDGDGVPADIEPRLFTRFVHEGTDVLLTGSLGLGTWVARSFAEAMGGTVDYERTVGETRFALTLPSADTRLAADDEAWTTTLARR